MLMDTTTLTSESNDQLLQDSICITDLYVFYIQYMITTCQLSEPHEVSSAA